MRFPVIFIPHKGGFHGLFHFAIPMYYIINFTQMQAFFVDFSIYSLSNLYQSLFPSSPPSHAICKGLFSIAKGALCVGFLKKINSSPMG